MTRPPRSDVPSALPGPDGGGPDVPSAASGGAPALVQVLRGAAIVGAIFLVGVGGLYLNRRAVAREVLLGWLDRRGVPADLVVEKADLDGFVARIRVGDPTNPDLTIERVEVDYAVGLPWSRAGLGLKPSRIRLIRPLARVARQNGQWTLGSLDGLIEELAARPPGPDQTGPLILVEQGRIALTTPGGRATILGDARIDQGRLQRLTARMPRSDLGDGTFAAKGLSAAVDLTTVGDQIRIGLVGTTEAVTVADQAGEDLQVRLAALIPYPDADRVQDPRRIWSDVRMSLAQIGMVQADTRADVRALEGHMIYDGRMRGTLQAFGLSGDLRGRMAAAGVKVPQGDIADLNIDLGGSALTLARVDGAAPHWTLEGPTAVSMARLQSDAVTGSDLRLSSTSLSLGGGPEGVTANGPMQVRVGLVRSGDLTLRRSQIYGRLQARLHNQSALTLRGQAQVQSGSWSGLGPPQTEDIAELAELKRALGDFALQLPQAALEISDGGYAFRLERTASLRPRSGGHVELAPGPTPLLAAHGAAPPSGSFGVRADLPGGLPTGRIDISHWAPVAGGFDVRLAADLDLDFGLARGLEVSGRGQLASRGGQLTFQPTGCSDVSLDRLELGESDVVDLTGLLCPDRSPLFAMKDGLWRVQGRLQAVSGSAPFLAMAARQATAAMEARGGAGDLGLILDQVRADVVDTTEPHRFNPLSLTGAVSLAQDIWQGQFDVATPSGQLLGQMSLTHDGRAGQGGVQIHAPALTFAEGGLQPQTLSPLAANFVASPVRGQASFQGRIDWQTGGEGTSSGQLGLTGLDFTSPVGPVRGLNGTIQFTNLAPLTTAPDQRLTAREIETVVTLRDPVLVFGLDKTSVTLAGGEVQVGGGRVRIEPLNIPLQADPSVRGVVVLENIQLGDLIDEAGFGESVEMDALVSGRLPFVRNPDGTLRFAGGSLFAVQPGRLSIHREALSGLEAAGGEAGAPPGMVEDLAYQAIEHLSFETLSADVDSQADGRLAVRFHINGAFDPPQRQDLRLTYAELLSRDFLNRTLPLPSGTQVNLTLDTTLNLDQLLQDLAEVSRARRGE